MQIGRSALLLVSTALNFFALRYLQLDEALSILFSTPFHRCRAVRAAAWRVGWLAAMDRDCVGFLGVLLVTRPGFGGIHPAALLYARQCHLLRALRDLDARAGAERLN